MLTKTLIGAARKFASLWRREKKLVEARRDLDTILKPMMLRAEITSVPVGHEAVILISTTAKRITKDAVVRFFGEDVAEKFWAQVPASQSEYLTVQRA